MDPIPAPDPATPAALAPAPMYLAAESMSRLTAVVCSPWQLTMAPALTLPVLAKHTRGVNRATRVIADIVGEYSVEFVSMRSKNAQS